MSNTKFTTYRFIRADVGDISNLFPSITVRFDVDNETHEIDCWWALCSPNDNFSKEEGKRIVDSRATKDSPYYMNLTYMKKFSLKHNFCFAVQTVAEDPSFEDTTSKFVYYNIKNLYDTIKMLETINNMERKVKDKDIFDRLNDLIGYFKLKIDNLIFSYRSLIFSWS